MLVFDSFPGLKNFMDEISRFLGSSHFSPPIPPPDPNPLADIEQNIIINIYDSFKKGNGTIVKQISGQFLHLLQLLVPSRNFDAIFKHLIYLEWMEHSIRPDGVSKLYRDHILHCANVCWVGHRLILDLEEPFYGHLKSQLKEILPDKSISQLTNDDKWMNFIKTTWYITAMIHDFGYPLELVKRNYTGDELYLCSGNYLKTDKLVDYFKNHLSGNILLFERQVKKIDKKILNKPFNLCKTVHPTLGCIELLHFLKKEYRRFSSGGGLYRDIYQLAALGILEHHKEGKIDFDRNPFGYVLALADTLHEWKRYICTGPVGRGSTKLNFIAPITKVIVEKKSVNLYEVTFTRNPHWRKCNGWNPDKFRQGKEEELKRLKTKTALPQFIIA